jgi:hypothetical protein
LKTTQILFRWLPTLLAFPIGGLLVVLTLGPIRDPLAAAVAGAVVGSVLGLAQWWALRPIAISFDWAWATAIGLMVASPVAWTLVDYSTSVLSLTLWGFIAGAIVGLGQALSQRLAWFKIIAWTVLVSGSWGVAWFISANVIVDAEASYAIFGSTGALAATVLLAIFLNPILSRTKRA